MAGSSDERLIRKGVKMLHSAIQRSSEPGASASDFLCDALVTTLIELFELPLPADMHEGDMYATAGVVPFNIAANLGASEREKLKKYLCDCVDEAAQFDGKGIEDGLMLEQSETPVN